MGLFAARRAKRAIADEPILSRGLLAGMLFIILLMGYLVQTKIQIPSFVLLLAAAIGLAVLLSVGLRRPAVTLYVMTAYLPFSKLLTGDFGGLMMAFNLTNLLFAVILMSWLANAATEGKFLFEPHILHLPVLLFACWGIVSFLYATTHLWSGYIPYTIGYLKRWLDPFAIYLLFFHLVKDRRRWRAVVVIIMIGVAVAALMAVHDYMGVREGTSLNKSRIGGIAGQPNILGAFFVYYAFLFAAFWLERIRQVKSLGLLALFLLCFRGIMVTFSRGAYLAFAQGLLGLAFFKNKLLAIAASALIIFAVLNPWLLPPGIRYRLETTFKHQDHMTDNYGASDPQENLDTSSQTRLVLWTGALQMIAEHPLMGVGLNRFHVKIGEYVPSHLAMDAHNAYLIMAAEFGVPALVLFLLMLLAVFRITIVVYRRTADPFIRTTALGFLGGLSGLLLANMFGSRMNTLEVSGYFWILAALMARAYLWTREEVAAQQPSRGRRRGSPRLRTGIT